VGKVRNIKPYLDQTFVPPTIAANWHCKTSDLSAGKDFQTKRKSSAVSQMSWPLPWTAMV
jgi:hypothetical protein